MKKRHYYARKARALGLSYLRSKTKRSTRYKKRRYKSMHPVRRGRR